VEDTERESERTVGRLQCEIANCLELKSSFKAGGVCESAEGGGEMRQGFFDGTVSLVIVCTALAVSLSRLGACTADDSGHAGTPDV
jgi:hypothetical protein